MMIVGLATVFAGGRSEPTPADKEPVALVFYHYASAAHKLYIEPLIEAFEQENDRYTIESVEIAQGGYEALAEKILLGFASGTPADVGQVGYTYLRTMVESGRPIALNPFMDSDPDFQKDNLFPAMMDLGAIEETYYLIPLGTSTPAMYINVDLFQAVGLDPNSPPASWAEAREASERLKAAGHQGIFWGWQITGNWIFQTLLENNGGKLTGPDGVTISFHETPGVEALTYMRDLVRDGLMPFTDQGVQTFVAGDLGMFVDSSFQRVNTPAKSPFAARLAPIPTPDGSLPLVPAGGNGVMMFAQDTSRQEHAWEFIRFVTGPVAGRIVAENSGYTPANREVVAALKKENADDADYAMVLDQVARVVPWHSWVGGRGTEIAQVLREMQEAVLLGRQEPDAALLEAKTRVEALLEQ